MLRTSIINEEQQQQRQQRGKLPRYARIESVSRLKVVWALAYCDLITIATGLLCHFPLCSSPAASHLAPDTCIPFKLAISSARSLWVPRQLDLTLI